MVEAVFDSVGEGGGRAWNRTNKIYWKLSPGGWDILSACSAAFPQGRFAAHNSIRRIVFPIWTLVVIKTMTRKW